MHWSGRVSCVPCKCNHGIGSDFELKGADEILGATNQDTWHVLFAVHRKVKRRGSDELQIQVCVYNYLRYGLKRMRLWHDNVSL